MKYFITILLILFSISSFAQRTPKPTTNPQTNSALYQKLNGYVGIDSGLMLNKRDSNWTPINNYFGIIINRADSIPYWWNGVKWQRIAAPSTNFVTIQQLIDSLAKYVTLATQQTITAKKSWNDDQTFNDTVHILQAVIDNTLKVDNKNTFLKVDSVGNIGSDFSNTFRNLLRNVGNTYHTQNYPPGVVSINQSFSLVKTGDTLPSMPSTRGSFNSFLTFQKRNSGDDTLNITNRDSSGSYKVNAGGIVVSTDSAVNAQNITWFNLHLPITNFFSSTVTNYRGYISDVTDLDIGTTMFSPYVKTSGATNFTIGRHTGLKIQPLISGTGINQTGIAFNQMGALDSVYFAGLIKLTGVTSSGTIASTLSMDANGNLIKQTFLPSVTVTKDFPSTSAQNSSELTATVTGATVGMTAIVNSKTINPNNTSWSAYVSSANTVTIRFNNYSAGSVDPSSGDFVIKVFPN